MSGERLSVGGGGGGERGLLERASMRVLLLISR